MESYLDEGVKLLVLYVPKFVGAILALLIGFYIIKVITNTLKKMMKKSKLDVSLHSFLATLVNILLKIGLVISVMGMVGIEMTSFIAILGAAGLAIGMALSGTLQNFAGGVMILLFKPFKVGDFIEAQGYKGVVKEIQIFNTILVALDNRVIIIPNSPLSSNSMVNYSAEELRRIDFTFGIGYGDDIDKARSVLFKVVKEDSRMLDNPDIFVKELADSSVNFAVRVWVKNDDYWPVYFDMTDDRSC